MLMNDCFTNASNIQQFIFNPNTECDEIYTICSFFSFKPRIPFDIPNNIPFNRRTGSPIWMRYQSTCRVNFQNLFFISTGCRANFPNLFMISTGCRANFWNLFLPPAVCRANVPNLKHPITTCKVCFPIRFWLSQVVKWLFRFRIVTSQPVKWVFRFDFGSCRL